MEFEWPEQSGDEEESKEYYHYTDDHIEPSKPKVSFIIIILIFAGSICSLRYREYSNNT